MQRRSVVSIVSLLLVCLGVAADAEGQPHKQARTATIVVRHKVRISGTASSTYWWGHMDVSASNPATIMICGTRTIPSRNAAEGYVFLSSDYGQTWRETLVDAATKWVSEHSCAFGENEKAYFLSSRSAFFYGLPHHSQGRSFLYGSSDSGRNWNVIAEWPFIDFASTAVGQSRRGSIFIFANHLNVSDPLSGSGLLSISAAHTGSWNSVMIKRDNDYGSVFSAIPTAATVLEEGAVVGVFRISRSSQPGPRPWSNRSAIHESIEIARSDDSGLSLNAPMPVSAIRPSGQLSEATMAVDRSLGPYSGRVYVSWAENSTRNIEIMLASSEDGGRTWQRQRIRQLPDRPRRLGLGTSPGITPPAVAVNKDGVVAVFWVENEGRCPNMVASLDGGRSFKVGTQIAPCGSTHSRDLAWYSHYLFSWPESEASEEGKQRDESRLGLRLQMRVQSLTPTSMIADGHGDFHPMWLAMREGGSQLWTATVMVTSEEGIEPKLPPLTDISSSIALDFTNNDFDPENQTFSVDVTAVNRGNKLLYGPFLLQMTRVDSSLGTVAGKQGPGRDIGCHWTPSSYLIRQGVLAPGDRSTPFRISTHLRRVDLTDRGDIDISLRLCGRD